MSHAGRRATIRSGWIVLRDETHSRLTSCFVLSEVREGNARP
jgi:hypothetical protein